MDERDIYAALIESSDDAIVAKDLDGIIVAWNHGAERIFGYTAEEIIGQSIRRLLPPSLAHEEDDILDRVRRGEKVGRFFTQRLHKTGKLIDLSVTVMPVLDLAGRVIGASKMARDATEYLAIARQLEESERGFRMLAENMSQFAWIARADGHIYWYNRRWYDYTGTTLEEMEGWGWGKVHHPDHLERVIKRFQYSLDTGMEWEDTFPLRGKDGRYRWFLSRSKPVRDESGQITHWFGTNTDITEQRDQADQIKLLLDEVNHRAKNMLATVQAIARRSNREQSIGEFVDQLERRVASLALNQDILVNRKWSEIPLHELVSRQLAFVGEAAGSLELAGPELWLTPRAAEIIGMALHELATNSLKYGSLSAREGKVMITWLRLPDDAGLEITWREEGGPAVSAPQRSGFGSRLIVQVPSRSLDADVTLDYLPSGIVWTLRSAAALA